MESCLIVFIVFLERLLKEFVGSLLRHLKAHKDIFSISLFSCKFKDQLSLNFHRFVILCTYNDLCFDTLSENTGL